MINLPIEWLSEISIVDTPGTNAIIRSHESITTDFIPRSDLVIFITSADRPFTESERLFLELVRNWGKKVVVVINKIDILQDDHEIQVITNFVLENSRKLLDVTPQIFPISARLALKAKQGFPDFWNASKFEALETFIRTSLDEKSRIHHKLLNPVGVALFLTDRYLSVVETRLDMLKEDTQMLVDVDSQLQLYNEDMERDFNFRMSDIENVLYEMERRGLNFFDERFKLTRVFDLFSKERIRHDFEKEVILDVPANIDAKVRELIDWLVDSDLRQWQAISEHLSERRRNYQSRIIGSVSMGNFSYDRDHLIDTIARESQRIVETYDKTAEAKAIAESAQDAVAASAILEVGAISLGAVITAMATTVAADVTGILMATFIAALGLVIIPARRRIAKKEMAGKIANLREQLTNSLRQQFQKEIDRSIQNIQNAISPYTRFVRSEQGKSIEMQTELSKFRLDLNRVKDTIETS